MKKILINDHRKIFAIQEDFHNMFHCLKIEFYSKPSKVGASSSKKIIKHPTKTLGECRVIHNKGTLTITPGMTVAELERNFDDVYGLLVNIFRKSGNAWLDTSLTGNWTLEQQNKLGEELSKKNAKESDANQLK